MSDFVLEVRPRPHYRSYPAPTMADPSDFVASFNVPPKVSPCYNGYLSPPPESCSHRSTAGASPMHLSPRSRYSPDSCCDFPTSHDTTIPSPCEDYSKEEVFDMVSSKQLSKDRTRSILEDSILVLTERLLHGRSIDSIDGTIRINLSGDREPITVRLSKVFAGGRQSSPELDISSVIKMKSSGIDVTRAPESSISEDWMQGLGHENECLRSDERRSVSSPAMHCQNATGEVCTVNTNGCEKNEALVTASKDVLLDVSVTEPGRDQAQRMAEDDTDEIIDVVESQTEDEEDTAEAALVIDIPSEDMEVDPVESVDPNPTSPEEELVDESAVIESETYDSGLEVSSSSSDGFSDEPEDSDESSTEKSVAPNGLEDAPGDSSLSHDHVAVSKSNSLVSKQSDEFVCKQCHQSLPNADAVAKHALLEHKLHCCTYCFKTFTAKNNLKRHVRLHTGLRPYKCTQCSQQFTRRDDLKAHMLRHDYNKPFRCSVCHKGYTDKACVKNHMAREHGSRRLIVCPQCGESFDNDDAFSSHKKTHPELSKFACKDCPFIGTNKLMTMKHSLIHSHKLFSCRPCNAFFPDPFNYTSHLRSHKSTPEFSQYICCFCDMVLPTYEQFVRHEYTHAQGKTYPCDTCHKQFNSKASAQEHSLAHKDAEDKISEPKLSVPQNEEKEEVLPACIEKIEAEVEQVPENLVMKIPEITVNEHLNEEMTCEGVLDLSIKKGSSEAHQAVVEPKQQPLSHGQAPTAVQSGPEYSAPRDGCAIGSPASSRSNAMESQVLSLFPSMERTEEPLYRQVYSTNAGEKTRETIPNFLDIPPDTTSQTRPQSTEEKPMFESYNKSHFLVRSLSGQCRGQVSRYSPYTKSHKYADFTQKFLAARGHQSALLKKGRPVLKPVFQDVHNQAAVEGDRIPSFLPSLWRPQADSTSMPEQQSRGLSPMRKSRGEQESCEISQLPTFIKSEPFFDTSSCSSHCATHKHVDQRVPVSSKGSKHSADATHVCEQCKEDFNSFQELENHSVNVHKRYLCEHCGKSFSARPNRDRHVRYHTGERPYKCDLCDQAFFRGDDLKYHRTTRHPTAQPFVCGVCSASFTWKKDLERHVRQSKCKM